jgi:DNA-binding MarR family transcriptional regulator
MEVSETMTDTPDTARGRGDSRAGARDYSPVEVARAVRRLDMALAEMHLELAGLMDMTAAELLAVAHLGMDGELGPTELASRLHLHTGAVTALLDRLADRDMVEREPHPSDRRKLLVNLTPHGREDTMRHLSPMVGEVIALVKTLPDDDRQTVGRFLDALAEVVARRRRAQSAS